MADEGHGDRCWRHHLPCAIVEIGRLQRELDGLNFEYDQLHEETVSHATVKDIVTRLDDVRSILRQIDWKAVRVVPGRPA